MVQSCLGNVNSPGKSKLIKIRFLSAHLKFGDITPITHPASPPASMLFARVTSLDQTSYCHLRSPRTPHSTRPLWMPTRMLRSTSVASTTDLRQGAVLLSVAVYSVTECCSHLVYYVERGTINLICLHLSVFYKLI